MDEFMDDYNKLSTKNENEMNSFLVLDCGAIVKYSEQKSDICKNGRLITDATPNGLAFDKLTISSSHVIARGTLLHTENDNRTLEEQDTIDDSIS